MSCSILASSVSCSLGHGVSECVENLRLSNIQVANVAIDHLEDPVTAPYFNVRNPDDLLPHQRMYQVIRDVMQTLIADAHFSREALARTGLFFGSSSFTVSDSEHQYFSAADCGDADALSMPIVGYNKFPELLAREFGLSSCVHSYATACTSSANALIYADLFMQSGVIDHAIVIGSEFYNATTLLGFHGLELLSPQSAMRPFDARRDGLVLGEGCAAVLVSKETDKSAMRFLAGACNTDSYSLTAANTDGSTIASVMQSALQKAGKEKQDVRAVKVHGTASLMNDEAEAAGIMSLFESSPPSIFALKPYIGHTLGACGMVELALLESTLRSGFVPANPGIAVEAHDLGVTLSQENSRDVAGVYVLNYFAFGGNNVSLVIERGV